jgi:hypothetical protein
MDTQSENINLVKTEVKERKERIFLKNRWNIIMKDDEDNVILDKSYKSHVDIIKCDLNHITSRQLLYYYLIGREKKNVQEFEEKTLRKSKYNIKITKIKKGDVSF